MTSIAKMPLELGKDAIGFMTSGVSILASMSDTGLTPVLARPVGCEVNVKGDRLSILLRDAEAAALLHIATEGRLMAVMFSRPSTNRSIQVKGLVTSTRPADASDQALADRYAAAMIAELAPLGFDEAFVRTILSTEGMSVVRLDIVPEFLFDQTPGPGAGQSLVR